MLLDVPVDPDADQAREWLIRELSGSEYRTAQPNWFDRLASAFWDWLMGLFESAPGGPPALGWILVLVVLAAALVAAFLIFGPPRLGRRSSATGAIFGEDDARTAAMMRMAADAAAAAGNWSLAIQELFRSLARGLAERAILTTSPGTTATGFALRARTFFPGLDDDFSAAAASFDGVRYLGADGSRTEFDALRALESSVRSRTPELGLAAAGRAAST